MRISNLRREGGARVAATISWEDASRPALDLFFETDDEFGADLTPDPNAFLVAAYFPAIRHGERRIAVEGAVSPRLRDGLLAVCDLFRAWYGGERFRPRLEPASGFAPPAPGPTARAAAFLSGGIDSLFTLRKNRLEIPADHPASIRDLLWFEGRELPGFEGTPVERRRAEQLKASLGEVARDTGANLVPVRTNVRHLDPDIRFFGYEFQGACLASLAHALAPRVSVVAFSSGWELANLIPWGTHPLVDPNLATEAVAVRHEGAAYGRAEKLRAIADWDAGLRNLTVCNDAPFAETLNCGACYKCVETMTLLLSEGLLAKATKFPFSDVTPGMIEGMSLAPNLRSSFREYAAFWVAMLPTLEARGRSDLARAAESKLREARRLDAWLDESDWKGLLKRLDRRLARGMGLRAVRALRPRR